MGIKAGERLVTAVFWLALATVQSPEAWGAHAETASSPTFFVLARCDQNVGRMGAHWQAREQAANDRRLNFSGTELFPWLWRKVMNSDSASCLASRILSPPQLWYSSCQLVHSGVQ